MKNVVMNITYWNLYFNLLALTRVNNIYSQESLA